MRTQGLVARELSHVDRASRVPSSGDSYRGPFLTNPLLATFSATPSAGDDKDFLGPDPLGGRPGPRRLRFQGVAPRCFPRRALSTAAWALPVPPVGPLAGHGAQPPLPAVPAGARPAPRAGCSRRRPRAPPRRSRGPRSRCRWRIRRRWGAAPSSPPTAGRGPMGRQGRSRGHRSWAPLGLRRLGGDDVRPWARRCSRTPNTTRAPYPLKACPLGRWQIGPGMFAQRGKVWLGWAQRAPSPRDFLGQGNCVARQSVQSGHGRSIPSDARTPRRREQKPPRQTSAKVRATFSGGLGHRVVD